MIDISAPVVRCRVLFISDQSHAIHLRAGMNAYISGKESCTKINHPIDRCLPLTVLAPMNSGGRLVNGALQIPVPIMLARRGAGMATKTATCIDRAVIPSVQSCCIGVISYPLLSAWRRMLWLPKPPLIPNIDVEYNADDRAFPADLEPPTPRGSGIVASGWNTVSQRRMKRGYHSRVDLPVTPPIHPLPPP